MSGFLSRWIEKEDSSPASEEERQKIIAFSKANLSHWNEISVNLSKWLLATLVTINVGGIAYSINLKIHPEAIRNAAGWLFLGMILALISGLVQLIYISRLRNYAFLCEFGDINERTSVSVKDFSRTYGRYAINFPLTILFSASSLFCTFRAGGEIIDGTKPCDESQIEFGVEYGDNVYPMKEAVGHCYFYSIKGLPEDPLRRAILERKLIERVTSLDKK